MDLPTALLRDLLQLASSIDSPPDNLAEPLSALIADLRSAVPSYRGLQLTITENGAPVNLTAFTSPDHDRAITTSLRLPFAVLGPGFDFDSRIVLYAATPGAFVDLAAGLGYALNTPTATPHPADRGAHIHDSRGDLREVDLIQAIVVDADLPPATLESGLTGLDEATTINRAVGILIDQAHHPNHADVILRHHAAAAGVTPHIYAARMLRR